MMTVWRKNTSRRKYGGWSKMASDVASHIRKTSFLWLILALTNTRVRAGELWPMERPDGMPVIQSLEVMCGKDHMDVHLTFSHPFEGIVSSKGQHGDPRCVYVPPSTGQTYFSFRIAYAKCGTKPDLHGQFYENTVVVQYDKDLLEVWDEAKRLRCEWFNDYEKTASKPPMVIADLDVVQLDFRGDNVDCWMEIQAGKGPWAPPVSGIVPLGSTLTLVVAINDYRGEFDMRVKSCAASDGSGHVIQLSDEYGCVLRPKMISRFLKAKAADERATVITYAFFHAFKFPDALSVHIRCKVEICRHGCLDHCQLAGVTPQRHAALDRKDDRTHQDHNDINDSSAEDGGLSDEIRLPLEEAFGDEVSGDAVPAPAPLPQRAPAPVIEPDTDHMSAVEELVEALARPFTERPTNLVDRDRFPHGPRNLGTNVKPEPSGEGIVPAKPMGPAVAGPRSLRKRRTVREGRSADVGVSGIYEVVSEADLAFGPSREPVTVFSGRIREEVVYGICMGAVSFGALFASAAGAAAGAALAAAVMLQKLRSRMAVQPPPPVSPAPASHSLAAWMALRLLGSQPHPHHSRDG
ncbi:zona pellucida domain-containing protein miniature [Anticarsia gemmatalis]|uniref:zona pellucida domain-containing protein miniature n=1 Tax=Anticarsia gemmatalis TaxID=129554 RepID=UPI003F76FC72